MRKSKQKHSHQVVHLALLGLIVLSAQEYARWTYRNHVEWADAIVAGWIEKPFVYRALVPWLAQILVSLGMRADIAITVFVVLSAIGLFYGLQYLFRSFR